MIETRGLTFGYGTGPLIVQDLDLDLGPGTMTGLVGRSGSGKSTLLYLLGLMVTATAGSLRIDAVETTDLPDWARADLRARSMGFVFQDALLDPARSVLDNVLEGTLYGATPPRQARTRALDLLERFGVEVDPWRRPGQISGGQAQRVALCRAFVGAPRIVLADEPSGNLDDQSADVVWGALRERAEAGAVVVVATHDRVRSSLCDQIVEVGHAAAS